MTKNNKNKLGLLLLTSALAATCVAGCGKKKAEETTTQESSIKIEESASMTDASDMQLHVKEGCIISDLTGEWIDESFANKRPLSIMINNIDEAMPQTGIQKADVTYEMYVEGSITRWLCVFQDYSDLPKLGPVRSARPYYVQMASMLDAFYGHVGWNSFAEEQINVLGVDNLNGLTNLSTIMYYRDNTRYAPHNVYTDTEKINAGIDTDGYTRDHKAGYAKMFAFNYDDTDIANGTPANKVSVPFGYNHPWFEYNSSDKNYYRFQYKDKQIDDATGEQLHYKNLIVMFVEYTDIHDGLLWVDWDKSGSGLYFTNGAYQPITWKKQEGVVRYFTADGSQLKMNPGKTFVEVYPESHPEDVTIE